MVIFVAFNSSVKLSDVFNKSYIGLEIFIEFHDGLHSNVGPT